MVSSKQLFAPTGLFSVPFLVCIIFLVLPLEIVKSITVNFPQNSNGLAYTGYASLTDGVIQLTRKNEQGKPLAHIVGAATIATPFQLYNRATGRVADFTTEFYFTVDPPNIYAIGDGVAFFIAPENFKNPPNSGGGYLGLVSPETALDATKNHIVAVEFDSFGGNDWDPNPSVGSNYPHVGININSIKSVKTAGWLIYFKDAGGAKAKARISYDSKTQTLSVLVNYFDTGLNGNTTLSHVIDLRTVLPERVVVGFSATTGDFVETHDIHTWSFVSTDV